MPRVRLLHWKEEECAVRAAQLAKHGHEVDASPLAGSSLKELRNTHPDAIVIDLSRLPSRGREVAIFLRQSKATRLIPLVFVDGDPEKVNLLKTVIPDARFTSYAEIGPVLEDAIAHPAREAVVPRSSSGVLSRPAGKEAGN